MRYLITAISESEKYMFTIAILMTGLISGHFESSDGSYKPFMRVYLVVKGNAIELKLN